MDPDLEIVPEPMELPDLGPAPIVSDVVDPEAVLTAIALALASAAFVAILLGRAWPRAGVRWRSVACLFGVALGLALGCRWLELWPNWPPGQVRERFLLMVLPAVLLAELACVFAFRLGWFCWGLRVVIAAGVGPALLHGTVYFMGSTTGTSSWSPGQGALFLGSLAVGLLAVWFLLARLAERAPSRSLPLSLALTCAGAGVTVMLSGYLSGGMLGLPLAAALSGAALVFPPGPLAPKSWIGPGVVGLFGLLVMGYFFGELKLVSAMVLFTSPLLNWIVEVPWFRALGPWKRASLGLMVATAPVIIIVLATL